VGGKSKESQKQPGGGSIGSSAEGLPAQSNQPSVKCVPNSLFENNTLGSLTSATRKREGNWNKNRTRNRKRKIEMTLSPPVSVVRYCTCYIA
jgi:hypothetical protein